MSNRKHPTANDLYLDAQRRTRRGEEGFTLVELLVVLVILSLISGLVAPRVLGYLTDARARSSALQMTALTAALDLFYLDTGRYPSDAEGLGALVNGNGIARWSGPYIQQAAIPSDPWGNAYAYRAEPGGRYRIISFGPDGVEGGGDDADSQTP
jgi:general secretion pathway protein G